MTSVPAWRPLSHEDVVEMAGLYVLGVLDPDESLAVRVHLDTCRQAHDELLALASMPTALGTLFEPLDPPVELKGRVMAAVAADVASADVASADVASAGVASGDRAAATRSGPFSLAPVRERRRPWSQWGIGTWAMASAAVLLIAALGAWNVTLQSRADDTDRQLTALQDRVEQADRRQALIAQAISASADPDSAVAVLRGVGQQAGTGFAAFPRDGDGYIVLVDLPPAPPGRTWQAWSFADGEAVSMGVMSIGEDGYAVLANVPFRPGTDLVALTIEEAGGAQQPSGEPVVSGELSA